MARDETMVRELADAGPSWLPFPLGPGQWPTPALCRAIAYCEANLAAPISVADIAAAAGLSVRALQEGFRAHLATTPQAYLRQLRLAGVHRTLLAMPPGDAAGTVTDVATRWGFSHLGRFAAYYRAAYGCSPSQTRSAALTGALSAKPVSTATRSVSWPVAGLTRYCETDAS